MQGLDHDTRNQVFGESLGLPGVPMDLFYLSNRVPGRKDLFTAHIPVVPDDTANALEKVLVEVRIAGRRFIRQFEPKDGLVVDFTWDGRDVWDREVQGQQRAKIRVGLVANAEYAATPDGQGLGPTAWDHVAWFDRGTVLLGAWDARHQLMGGWSLSGLHAYDPQAGVIYFGNGGQREVNPLSAPAERIAGCGDCSSNPGDGVDAKDARLSVALDAEYAPDGSLIIADGSTIRRVNTAGIIETIAGGGSDKGEGVPATEASLTTLSGLTVASDGTIYFSELGNNRVRAVLPNQTIETIAGTGDQGRDGDGGPATDAELALPAGLAIGPDGALYIADEGNGQVRVVRDGQISSVFADGKLEDPHDVAFDGQGVLYVADLHGIHADAALHAIDRVGTPVTVIRARKASDSPSAFAIETPLMGLAVATDGSIYATERDSGSVRGITADGGLYTVVPRGSAGKAPWVAPRGLTIAPDGALVIVDKGAEQDIDWGRIFKLPTASFFIADETGAVFFEFDRQGRHLRTSDPFTGVVHTTFEYGTDGLLEAFHDPSGNRVELTRDALSQVQRIVGIDGEKNELRYDESGMLERLETPNEGIYTATYDPGGLLRTLQDETGTGIEVTYDPFGLMLDEITSWGDETHLERTETEDGWTVTNTNAAERSVTLTLGRSGEGTQRVAKDEDDRTTTFTEEDGTIVRHTPDGSSATLEQGPDPTFGDQAKTPKRFTFETPSGKTATRAFEHEVETREDGTIARRTDTMIVADATRSIPARTTVTYDAATRQSTTTLPSGRSYTETFDELGRIVRTEVPGLTAVEVTYDERGRLESWRQGDRVVTITYDSEGRPKTVTNPLQRTLTREYDTRSRVRAEHWPGTSGLKGVLYGWNEHDVFESVRRDGETASHTLAKAANGVGTYTAPGSSSPELQLTLDDLNRPATATRADGKTLVFAYDNEQRLSALTIGTEIITPSYDATTGELSALAGPDASVAYGRDGPLLTAATTSGAVSGVVSATYDENLRIATTTVGGTTPVSVAYDEDGVPSSVGGLTVTRHPEHGLVTSTTIGVTTTSYEASPFAQLATLTASANGATHLAESYEHDKVGRITNQTDTLTSALTTHDYTPEGWLDRVQRNGSLVASYTRDTHGNVISRTDGSGTITGTFDEGDQLLSWGAETFHYTENGELDQRVNGAAVTQYQYTGFGHLRRVVLPNSEVITYHYDPQGRRIAKDVGGVRRQSFLYGTGVRPVAELDAANNVIARFVYATTDHVPDYMAKGGETYRIITDYVGSVRYVVNTTTGAVAQALQYDPWGRVTQDTNPGFQPFGFAGGLYDRDTGLVRFGVRDYDPTTGRFTTRDPEGLAAGLNAYLYAGGDPINFIDPDGRCPAFVVNVLVAGTFAAMENLMALTLWSMLSGDCLCPRDLWNAALFGFVQGAAFRALGLAFRFLSSPNGMRYWCFPQGTDVHTAAGKRPIEEIQPGELVLSRNEGTGEYEYALVRSAFSNDDQPLYRLEYQDQDGVERDLTATADHPVRTADGWTALAEVSAGAGLVLQDMEAHARETESGLQMALRVQGFISTRSNPSSLVVHQQIRQTRAFYRRPSTSEPVEYIPSFGRRYCDGRQADRGRLHGYSHLHQSRLTGAGTGCYANSMEDAPKRTRPGAQTGRA
ncbi:MAG: RHS repeat-associated core domain-containing protein [Myxococcota bacterium]